MRKTTMGAVLGGFLGAMVGLFLVALCIIVVSKFSLSPVPNFLVEWAWILSLSVVVFTAVGAILGYFGHYLKLSAFLGEFVNWLTALI